MPKRTRATATFYEINLVRAKTQHPTRVLVERSVAWPYMAAFVRSGKVRGNDFVFPIYFDEDPEHQFERITYANNVINRSLQRSPGASASRGKSPSMRPAIPMRPGSIMLTFPCP